MKCLLILCAVLVAAHGFDSFDLTEIDTGTSVDTDAVDILDYNSTDACCQLESVKLSPESLLSGKVKVLSLNTSEGIVYVSMNDIGGPKFLNHKRVSSFPWKKLKLLNLLSNPNGCILKWTENYTEGLDANSFVPRFPRKYIMTTIKYKPIEREPWYQTTRRPRLSFDDDHDIYYSLYSLRARTSTTTTTTTTESPSNVRKVVAELYRTEGDYSIKSSYDDSGWREDTKSLLHIACPETKDMREINTLYARIISGGGD